MPTQTVNVERSNFSGGLITEASPLIQPENTALTIDNFDLNRDGSISRRSGMKAEAEGVVVDSELTATTFAYNSVRTFEWTNVNDDPSLSIGVVQAGNRLWFFDLFSDTLSTNMLNGGLPLIISAGEDKGYVSGNSPMSFAAIAGQMIVCSKEMDYPLLVEYHKNDDEVGYSVIKLLVRDLWGEDDGLAANYRPRDLENDHRYNLYNQGWLPYVVTKDYLGDDAGVPLYTLYPAYYWSSGATKFKSKSGGQEKYLTNRNGDRLYPREYNSNHQRYTAASLYARHGRDGLKLVGGDTEKAYPSNADIAWIGKTSAGGFDHRLVDGAWYGTSPAPKGKYIIDAFARGASRESQSGLSGLAPDLEQGKLSTVAAFANRIFYSGVDSKVEGLTAKSPSYSGSVFFTRHIDNVDQLGKCYQIADPTSEDDPSLVPTDGGYINITEATAILKLIPIKSSLMVVAENGVWELSGVDGVFRADSHNITKVTNVGCINADSIVVVEDTIFYWTNGGIYTIVASNDSVSSRFVSSNVTQSTIQTHYNSISNVARANCTGHFDVVNRKLSWLYSDATEYNGVTNKHNYNRELVLDVALQAFYTRTIQDAVAGTYVAGYLSVGDYVTVDVVQDVVVSSADGEEGVVTAELVVVDGEQVVVTTRERGPAASVTKYLSITPDYTDTGNYGLSFSLYSDTGFTDWGESDAPAQLITGAETQQDTQRDKSVRYLTTHFTRTETGFNLDDDGELVADNPSSCNVRALWEFSNHVDGGKEGKPFQAYRLNRNYIPQDIGDEFNYGSSVITTKTKLRGNGRSLALRFDSEAGRDLRLLGWSMPMEVETSV
jgi:hypothetical protein